jgi:hypothetical protein
MSAIWVIDDFIDLNYQEQIKNVLMGEEEFNGGFFPWYYVRDITDGYKENSQGRAGLSHVYVNYEEDSDTIDITSDHHGLFLPLLRHACHTLNIKNAEIIQGRSFLQFPLNLKSKEDDTPHVDLLRTDFFVVLYYVCDADGDTVIYNEREESDKYTVNQRVTPKQGRAVLFDGGLYHTAQQCTNKIRCVVNYNLALVR